MTAARRGSRPAKLAATPAAKVSQLPFDYAPMEAKPVTEIPSGAEWQYEPKWDGFRCLAFRDGDEVTLMSKAGKPLTRYFPEIVAAIRAMADPRFVLDGELVVPDGGGLSFDQLLQRIHPAESRIRKLALETPAEYVVFDYLMTASGERLVDIPLEQRRIALEAFASRFDGKTIRLSPATRELRTVQRWFKTVGSGLDGIIAKRLDLPYQSGTRNGMQKLKHRWTADCVVGGFRYATSSTQVGSLLLGLFNAEEKLDHVGFLSAIRREERAALTERLNKLIKPPGFTGNAPGGPSRWSTARSAEWQPVAPKLVVEVEYDHFTNGRFRHATRFVRWRPDKTPRSCTVEQLPARNRSALTLLDR
jgi:ATP-dependent DNA ligase